MSVELFSQDPAATIRHEAPIDLNGASAFVATDYVKKPHVFRLKLGNGGDYLFQCKDEVKRTLTQSDIDVQIYLHIS